MDLLSISSIELLLQEYKRCEDEALARAEQVRESKWTESVAVGSRSFVETIKTKLGVRAKRRSFSGTEDEVALREPQAGYSDDWPF